MNENIENNIDNEQNKNEETGTRTFEAAMKRLEEIVIALDDGSAPLDELIKLFEEGTSLVKHCNSMLDAAESKVKILTEKDGKTVETDFEIS